MIRSIMRSLWGRLLCCWSWGTWQRIKIRNCSYRLIKRRKWKRKIGTIRRINDLLLCFWLNWLWIDYVIIDWFCFCIIDESDLFHKWCIHQNKRIWLRMKNQWMMKVMIKVWKKIRFLILLKDNFGDWNWNVFDAWNRCLVLNHKIDRQTNDDERKKCVHDVF